MAYEFKYHYYRVEDERGLGVGDCQTLKEAQEHAKALKDDANLKGLKVLEIGVINTYNA